MSGQQELGVEESKPVDLFSSTKSLYIKQSYLTTDYCCCCFSVNGEYYEIRTSEDDKAPILFRADENLDKGSILVKDKDGFMFVQLIGHVQCQCGCFPDWHKRIDVHCTPGELAGTVHYIGPSEMLIKDGDGELLFRLLQQSPTPPTTVKLNFLRRPLVTDDAKFQVFSIDPEFNSQPLGTLRRKKKNYSYGQGFTISLNFEEDLDLESKALIFGAAFPVGVEYEGAVVSRDEYEKVVQTQKTK